MKDFYALVDDFGPARANHVNVIRSTGGEATTIADQPQPTSTRVGNYSEQASTNALPGTTGHPNIDKSRHAAVTGTC
ncbi:MAG: hypothetical protein ACNYPE_05210 [Candidatus Azotimanducaceae bacterium WSBS_2022_MAG_OTU7]